MVGGLHVVRNGLAIKDIFIRSQHKGTFLSTERDGSVFANRPRISLLNKEAWTLEIFKVNERAEMELRASRELMEKDLLPASPRDSNGTPSPNTSTSSTSSLDRGPLGASSDFLPIHGDEGEDMDAMYYFGFKSHLGRYLGVESMPPIFAQPDPPPPSPSPSSSSTRPPSAPITGATPPSTSSLLTSSASAPGPRSRSPRSPLVVNASIEEPNFNCLWVIYQIRRGVWGLKSQRGDGPWLCVEVDTGELVLLDEPLPVDARFFWGFTTVRKRVKLLGSHHRYLSAELNRSVIANRERAGPWETWIVERLPSNKWTLLSYHGYYLSGLNDGMVVANQGVPREAEQWELIPIRKGFFGLKSLYSRYLCITPEKDGRVLSQAQNALKAKRLEEWALQKDYQLRRITKTLIPLSSVADIPLPSVITSPVPSAATAVLSSVGVKNRRISFPPGSRS